ncbi:unnamed protein product, partial [Ixodes persulcatus]
TSAPPIAPSVAEGTNRGPRGAAKGSSRPVNRGPPSSRPWIPRTKLPSPPWTLRRAATAPPDSGIDQQAPAGSSTAPAPTPDPDHALVPEKEAGAPAGGLM